MNTITITIRKNNSSRQYSTTIPSDWSEVTPAQAKRILPLLLAFQRNERMRIELLRAVCDRLPTAVFLALDATQIADMLPLIAWLENTPLSIPVLPTLAAGGRWVKTIYHLPKEKLENATCFEWWAADGYYKDFQTNFEPEDLNRLVATLCREASTNLTEAHRRDDVRVPLLSRAEIETRAAKLKQLEPDMKLYVLYFFSGCKEWVFEQFGGLLFEEEEEGSEDNPLGWLGLFQKAAETGVFGNLDQVLYHTKFLDFCTWMVGKKLEYERMKREMEKRQAASRED